ncbi:bone morphogenetic protein 2-like [Alligator mississippiensis]|uniref:Bone morphogenetic protein 2-like n=1 Tax=Alligator mississippiensis TaxID=8496 RepID=A0A151NVP1_ALLMI|nr:bone morphogenetic protein 2-like [Alligator mississippiensis]
MGRHWSSSRSSHSPSDSRSRSKSVSPPREKPLRPAASPAVGEKLKKADAAAGKETGAAKPKLTPQEKLKLRMQKALNRQFKADKKAAQEKMLQQEHERQEREDELRAMARKIRMKERERREKEREEWERQYSRQSRSPSPRYSREYSSSRRDCPVAPGSAGGQQRGPEDGGAAGWSYVLFNISGLPDEEELLALELRFSRQEMVAQGSRISLYHAPDPSEVAGGQHWLLEHRVVAQDQPRWQSFDVTAAVRVGKRQLGFLVEVVHRNSSSLRDLHLRARRSPREAEGRWAPERPLLVTYSHDQRSKALSAWGKRSRGTPFVDFRDMGWDDWIVALSGYHAFYCHGECRFPLAAHMNSSSHAMVQTLLSSVNASVPWTCCVPTMLSPVALLYLGQHDVVVLKTYEDMVVDGCGCR